MSTEDEIRSASAKFYGGLNRLTQGDASQLADSWSHSDTVTTLHPIGGEQIGWTEVKESFDQVAGLASGGHVELIGQTIQSGGELAYEVGIERGSATLNGESITFEQRVTNIYRRENGEWKIVHHHTDLSPSMLGVLERLKRAA